MSLTVSPERIVEESESPLLAAPNSWPRRPLGEVASILNGFAFKSELFVPDGGKPLVRIRDLFQNRTAVSYSGDYDDRYIVRSGDLLVGMDGDFNCARWRGPEALLNQRVCRITPDPKVLDINYLTYLLPGYLHAIHDYTSSTTVKHLSSRDIARIPIPVPPLSVQRASARAVDGLELKRRSSLMHADAARRAVERFRQSVLAAACSGRLTANWRAERAEDDWTFERAADVCAKVQSGTTPKDWYKGEGGIPFLKVYNIVDQRLDFNYKPQFISPELHGGAMVRAKALPGDVLMNIVGPPLGKVAVVTNDFPEWSINQALTLFRPSDRITTDWLYAFLRSGIPVRAVLADTRGTVGQANISLSQCRDFIIPVPPLAEQGEIVRRVERLLALGDALERRIDAARRRIHRTGQATLAKAFRGELMTSESTRKTGD